MFKYTAEERKRAVALSMEVGINKTCKQLGMSIPTLRRWRREERVRETARQSAGVNPKISYREEVLMDEEKQDQETSIHGIEEALRRELADARQLNRITQETIDYLIAENRELRRRCERYLKALAMIVE